MKIYQSRLIFLIVIICVVSGIGFAQTPTSTPPPPGPKPSLNIPVAKSMRLSNGLTIAVIQRPNLPLVTASMVIRTGAKSDPKLDAGLTSMTAELLTKGTTKMSASEFAEATDFIGANLSSWSQWDSSSIRLNVVKDKLDQGLSLMSEAIKNPSFEESELELLKKQANDGFDVSMTQPGSIMNYAESVYTFGRPLSSGTPKSLKGLTREKIADNHTARFLPSDSVLIFTGDVTPEEAFAFGEKYFGDWDKGGSRPLATLKGSSKMLQKKPAKSPAGRIIVIDLPDSGQAAIGYAKRVKEGRIASCRENCESNPNFYVASVLNSVLGGGYSSRLNQEIRLKRGLSYGAGSGFSWDEKESLFRASAQTKNETADEVAELMSKEIARLMDEEIPEEELIPRKAVLTGQFGRSLQTNTGLAGQLGNIYFYRFNPTDLNNYIKNIDGVTGAQIKEYAKKLDDGDLYVVGDAKVFFEGLKKRFPKTEILVVKVDELDLDKPR